MDEQLAVTKAPAVQTHDALHALVQAKEAEYEQLREVYNDLWQQRKTATLDREGYITYLMAEDRMALLLEELEALRPQRDAARVREAVLAAQQHHDAAVPEAFALAEQAVQVLCAVAPVWQALATLFDDQQTSLAAFRDGQGSPAFPWLAGGAVDAQTLFVALYNNDPRALDAFRLLMTPLTVGHVRAAMATCPRLQPFAPRAIRNYLQPLTEGQTNGSR